MKINTVVQTPKTSSVTASRRMIWLLSFTVFAFLVWAAFASVDQIVRGSGKLVPTSNTQVIQNLEGGIISELLVWEGKIVEKGDVLARLNDKRFKGAYKELQGDKLALEVKLKRLDAEIQQKDVLALPQAYWENASEVADSETKLFEARTTEYKSARSALKQSAELHTREVQLLERSVKSSVAPEIELVKAKQSDADIKSQLSALETEYSLTRAKEYSETLTELNKVKANLEIRRDQLNRTVLIAPSRAIVNKVLITTIGGVAPPGEPILELTPLDDELRIEAEILPKDVAYVFPDMPATIKLSAYDYTIYGSFKGKVVNVSADTFEKPNGRDSEPYYKVLIELDTLLPTTRLEEVEIRPGMLAETELHVGKQTILSYLIKPLFKASQAFREP